MVLEKAYGKEEGGNWHEVGEFSTLLPTLKWEGFYDGRIIIPPGLQRVEPNQHILLPETMDKMIFTSSQYRK